MEQQQSPPAASPQGEGPRGLVKWAEKVQGRARTVGTFTRRTSTRIGLAARSAGKAASLSWKGLETTEGAVEGVKKAGEAAPRKVGEGASAAKEQLEHRKEEAQATAQKAKEAGRNITEALGAAKQGLAGQLQQAQKPAPRKAEGEGRPPEQKTEGAESAGKPPEQKPEGAEKAGKPPEQKAEGAEKAGKPPEQKAEGAEKAGKPPPQKPEEQKSPPKPAPPEGEPAGYLGMTTLPVQLPSEVAEAQHSPRGLILLNVEKDGPAEKAGLQLGDTLLKLDGRPLNEVGDLVAQLSREHLGRPMQAIILRAGSTRDVTLTVQPRQ